MLLKLSAALMASFAVMGSVYASPSVVAPKIGAASIGGTVSSAKGVEAGVWVIAETAELGNRFVKIVVTDEQGRFVLPDLPKAKYKVWSRGYGLMDSEPVEALPGKTVSLKNAEASSPVQAAEIYPANYWSSLIRAPAASEFPGTGPKGNGISPAFKIQEHWIAHMVENCQFCHQLGTKRTRTLPDTGNPHEAWSQRVSVARSPDDIYFADDKTYQSRYYGERMSNLLTLFGRERGLDMFTDWTTRIAKGEVPASAPARPAGIERNVVITTWDMGGQRFMHDSSSSYKLDPTVNANGPVYGYSTFSGMVSAVDPATGKEQLFKMHDRKGNWFKNANNHTGAMDSKGRLWMTNIGHYTPKITRDSQGENPAYCTDPANKFAKYFPQPYKEARLASIFDPKAGKDEVLPMCFGTHHLNFDKNGRLYFSGDTQVMGWVDVDAWDKTKDLGKTTGWCPFVLDTNGDGKITPDNTQWNLELEGVAGGEGADFRDKDDKSGKQTRYVDRDYTVESTAIDPKKDTRMAGYNYGMAISPIDQSYWAARYSPYVPSGVFRVETGSNPPQTCKTEYYEAPRPKGKYQAFNARGVDVDNDGVAWVAFGTGSIGKFDRSKCKVLNGPKSATGHHCPEGWEIIETPTPKFKGTNVGADWFYLVFVDNLNTLGLGKGVPIFPNSSGDELLAYLPKEKKFVHLRVPYPTGFYARGVDGRIDDAKTGWKGRGLWATNNNIAPWHQETGEGSNAYAAHFQLRPNPLAD